MTDYETGRISMISGLGEALGRKYKKVKGKSGNFWFIPLQDNPADNIYMDNPKDRDSKGFGGRIVNFELDNGEVYLAHGPWHSNADSLFEDTGIDVRDLYFTKVILGTGGVEYQGGHSFKIKEVVYQEDEFKLGSYRRGEELAQEYANKLKKNIHGWIESKSGGHSIFTKPKED